MSLHLSCQLLLIAKDRLLCLDFIPLLSYQTQSSYIRESKDFAETDFHRKVGALISSDSWYAFFCSLRAHAASSRPSTSFLPGVCANHWHWCSPQGPRSLSPSTSAHWYVVYSDASVSQLHSLQQWKIHIILLPSKYEERFIMGSWKIIILVLKDVYLFNSF